MIGQLALVVALIAIEPVAHESSKFHNVLTVYDAVSIQVRSDIESLLPDPLVEGRKNDLKVLTVNDTITVEVTGNDLWQLH